MKPGLRAKLALALIATSAVTLIAAMAALVPPLQHRIAADRLDDMRELAGTARLALARMPASDLRPGAERQATLVRDLERRMGGRVAILDARGAALADTDPGSPISGTGPRSEVRDGEAIVVVPVRTRAGRRTIVLRKSLRDTAAAATVVRAALPIAAVAGLAAALALSIGLSFGLLRRLERLRRGARRLADEGIGQPLDLRAGRDEVGEVAIALERMRARLHAEEQGRQAFLDTASHELRTPLASLRGTVELLREELAYDAPDVESARHRAEAALRQVDRLSGLASDLLELRRVDAEAPLAAEPVDLAELAETIAAEAEARAHAAGIALDVEGPEPAWALGDPRAVARILRALLDNSLRYGGGHDEATRGAGTPGREVVCATEPLGSRRGGSVTIEAAGSSVCVRDTGPGIRDDERELIFGRFERGSASGAAGGFGLGLPLARGLARRMGGDVRAEAAEHGARFVVTLPACPAPLPVGAAARGYDLSEE
jgi:signal transduction histidine kinase